MMMLQVAEFTMTIQVIAFMLVFHILFHSAHSYIAKISELYLTLNVCITCVKQMGLRECHSFCTNVQCIWDK